MKTASDWFDAALERLEAAHLLHNAQHHGEAVSRLYFACFTVAKGYLISKGIEVRTHNGVHTELYKLIGGRAQILHRLRDARRDYDYRLVSPGAEQTGAWLEEAEKFIRSLLQH